MIDFSSFSRRLSSPLLVNWNSNYCGRFRLRGRSIVKNLSVVVRVFRLPSSGRMIRLVRFSRRDRSQIIHGTGFVVVVVVVFVIVLVGSHVGAVHAGSTPNGCNFFRRIFTFCLPTVQPCLDLISVRDFFFCGVRNKPLPAAGLVFKMLYSKSTSQCGVSVAVQNLMRWGSSSNGHVVGSGADVPKSKWRRRG